MSVVFADAVGKNVANATCQHIDVSLSNWFRNCKDRQGGRKRRYPGITAFIFPIIFQASTKNIGGGAYVPKVQDRCSEKRYYLKLS